MVAEEIVDFSLNLFRNNALSQPITYQAVAYSFLSLESQPESTYLSIATPHKPNITQPEQKCST